MTESSAGTVYIVDDDSSLCRALERLFHTAGLRALSFVSADAFLQLEGYESPACVILDLEMPGRSGLELQDELGRSGLPLPVIFLTGFGDVPRCARALKAGALDFIEKPVDSELLLSLVNQGLSRSAVEQRRHTERQSFHRRLRRLTARETEVLGFVVKGLMNKEIAGLLGTAEKTIKVHRGRVMRKTGVRSIAELVSLVERFGVSRS